MDRGERLLGPTTLQRELGVAKKTLKSLFHELP